jgi:hypothetical protein
VLLVVAVLGVGAGTLLYQAQAAAPAPAKAPAGVGQPKPAFDLTKIDRTIRKEPAYRGKPRYGLLVLGPKAQTRIWLVIDDKTLYVDRNGNGDLTEKGEQFSPTKDAPDYLEFKTGEIIEADGQTKHSNLIVYQYYARQYDRLVNAAILYDVAGISSQGTSGEDGCSFTSTPREAPIIHLNGPMTMRVYRVKAGDRSGWHLYEYSEQFKDLVDAFPSDPALANKPGRRLNEVPCRLPRATGSSNSRFRWARRAWARAPSPASRRNKGFLPSCTREWM